MTMPRLMVRDLDSMLNTLKAGGATVVSVGPNRSRWDPCGLRWCATQQPVPGADRAASSLARYTAWSGTLYCSATV